MKSEKRKDIYLESIIENSPISIIAVDASGKVMLWNKAAEKTFGWKQSEIIGKANPIIPKNRKEEFEELLTKSLKGENVIDFHTIRKCKNGADIHVSISVSAWKDEEGFVIGGIAQMIDISKKIKAENELIESKKELETFFNSSGDALFIHDLKGRMLKVNDEACRRLGYTADELLTLTPMDLDSDKFKPVVKQRIKEITKNKSVTFETEHVTKNGKIIPTEIKSTSISLNKQKAILSIARDISVRKKSELKLKESEERFRNAIVLSPMPIMIHDEDDNVIQLSNGWTKYSGYNLEDIPTLGDWTEKAYGSRSGYEKEYIDKLFEIEETVNNGEWKVKCKNGEVRVWEFYTTPLGISGAGKKVLLSIAFDLTGKKKAEEDLRKSEEKFRNIFEDNIAPMFLIDPDNGDLVDVNEAAVKFYGWKRDEMLRMNINQINTLSPGEIKTEMENARNLRRVYFEFQHKRAYGSVRDVEVFGSKIEIEGKEYLHSIVHDITQRKLAEAQLKNFNHNWQLLTKATQQLNSVLELQVVIRQLVVSARELTGAKEGTAGLLIDGKMVFKEYDQNGNIFPIDYSFEKDYGVPGWVMATCKPYITNNVENDEHVIPEIQKALGFYNLADVPIFNKHGEIIGCFEMHNKPGNFDEHDVMLLQNLAAGAAIAIENSQMIIQRKQAEELLRDSEKKYREFFEKDLSGDFLSTVDGKLIDCNPAFLRIMGYQSLEDINENHLLSIYINDKDRDNLIELVKENKEVDNYELSLVRKDGSEIYVIENVVGVFDDKGNLTHLRGYIFDITDRKIAEEKLQHVHSLLYAIRNINQLIVTEKNIDVLMQGACEILLESRGYSSAWIGLTNDQNKVDKVFQNGFGKRIDTLSEKLKKGILPHCITLPTLENPIIKSESVDEYCKDCIMKPVREGKGVIVSLIKHFNNIYGTLYIITENIDLFTEEEESLIDEVSGDLGLAIYIQQEEQKREIAETRLQNAIDIIPEVISIVNKEGRIEYLNKAGLKTIKAELSDIVGKKPSEVIPKPIADFILPQQKKVFETKAHQKTEAIIELGNGKRWFILEYFPLFDENGDVKEIFGTARDITESKTYEQKFIQLAEGVASKVGDEFFDVLVENLSKTLSADVVLIGKVNEDDVNRIDTVSVFQFGKHVENFTYDLTGAPCKNVVNKKLYSYEKDVTKIFPSDQILIDLKIEGYIGTPLWDSKGNAIGILVCLFKSPIENVKIKESIIHVFGLRAAAEIERLEQLAEILKQRNELEESEEKFRSYVENAFDGIYVMKETHYEYVNKRFCELTGYSEKELTSPDFDFKILLTEKSFEIVKERLEARKLGIAIPQTYETEIRSRDGIIRDVEIGTVKIGEKDDLKILGFMHDIAERNQAIKKIKESEKRFRSITQTANDAIVTADSDGIIIGWNPSAERIFGYSAEDALSKSLSFIIPPGYRKQHLKGMQRVAGGGEHRVIGKTIELEGLHKNGKIFPVELSLAEWTTSGRKYYTGIMRDISERKRTEEEIKKLSTGVEQSSSSIVITDVEGNIEYVNKKFTEITGYTSEEALGKNPRILKSGKNDPNIYKELWTTIKAGKEWHGELLNKKKSGELFWESESISPIVNSHGKITHFIAIKDDITEHKKLVEELREAQIKAEAADKMKSEFLAQMSHEIRSPLNAVLNFTNIIKEETSDIKSEVLEISFSAIDSASKRIIRTVDLILNMTDLQIGTYSTSARKINLAELLKHLIKDYESVANSHKLELIFDSTLETAEIETDDYAVNQIFVNLIDNAIKYTHKGFVKIRLHSQENEKYTVEVEDSGIGISEEYLPDLFSPFSQEEHGYSRKYEGNGLGLALVKRYCEIIGANISVKSKKDVGTTFTVTIPNNFSQHSS